MKTKVSLFAGIMLIALISNSITFSQEIFREHTMSLGRGSINQIAFSPDGNIFAVASEIGVWLYNSQGFKEVIKFIPDQNIGSLTFSPNGMLLAWGVNGYSNHVPLLRVWNRALATKTDMLGEKTNPSYWRDVNALTFSPDGEFIAAAAGNNIYMWNVIKQKRIAQWESPHSLNSLVFTPDGKYLVSVEKKQFDWQGKVIFWKLDLENGTAVIKTQLPIEASVIAFSSPNSSPANLLALQLFSDWKTNTSEAHLLDITLPEKPREIAIIPIEDDMPKLFTFSPDSKLLAFVQPDPENHLRVWDVTLQKEIATFKNDGFTLSLSFGPDGGILASAEKTGIIHFWDIVNGEEISLGPPEHMGRPISLTFSPDSNLLFSMTFGGLTRIWDLVSQEIITIAGLPFIRSPIIISPDGKLLIWKTWEESEGNYNSHLWDISSQKEVGAIKGAVFSFSPDGKLLAGIKYRTLRPAPYLWDVASQQEVTELKGYESVGPIIFSPDGKLVSFKNRDRSLILWDIDLQKEIANLKMENRGWIRFFAFSPDSKLLALIADDKNIHLWDIASQKEIALLVVDKFPLPYNSMVFSPDGKLMAVKEGPSGIYLWDTTLQKKVVEFNRARTKPWDCDMAFSSNGKFFAFVDVAGRVVLWDINLQKEIAAFYANGKEASAVTFSSDGKWLAAGANDEGTICLWDITGLVSPQSSTLEKREVHPQGKHLITLGFLKTAVFQNFPNPFNPETWIPFELAESANVMIEISNATGQLVRTINLGQKPAGSYLTKQTAAHWDGKDSNGEEVASGVYFYTLQAGDFQSTRRMVILK